jgi:hypothetical protein
VGPQNKRALGNCPYFPLDKAALVGVKFSTLVTVFIFTTASVTVPRAIQPPVQQVESRSLTTEKRQNMKMTIYLCTLLKLMYLNLHVIPYAP